MPAADIRSVWRFVKEPGSWSSGPSWVRSSWAVGPGAAACSFLLGSVVGFGCSWLVLHRTVPWLSFRPCRPRIATLRSLLAPGLAFLTFPLSNALSVQGLTIVVGGVLGSAAVVVFSTTRTLTRVVTQIMSSINLAIWPELSRSIGSRQMEQARLILRRAVQLSLFVSLAAAMTLIVIGPAIIRAWTHGLVDPPMPLLGVLLLVVVANSFWFTLTTSLVATNRHARQAVVYLSSTTIALLLAIPFAVAFGLVGAAVALLAIDLAMSIYVVPAALRIVEDSPNSLPSRHPRHQWSHPNREVDRRLAMEGTTGSPRESAR